MRVPAQYTSQRCSVCGQVDPRSRESQAVFRCTSCSHAEHADVNAARNILAAGLAVTACEDLNEPPGSRGSSKQEPAGNREELLLPPTPQREWVGIPGVKQGRTSIGNLAPSRLRTRQNRPMWSRSSPVDGFRLAFDRFGTRARRPSCCCTDGPATGYDYRRVVPILGEVADIIVPDLRGFGGSGQTRGGGPPLLQRDRRKPAASWD